MKSPETKISISLNSINFVFYAGVGCLVPFLGAHLRSLGLTPWNAVCVHVASGLACVLVPALLGAAAERKAPKAPCSRHRSRLCFGAALIAAAAAYGALLAVPRVLRVPRQPLLDFDCASPLSAMINVERCPNWGTCGEAAAAWGPDTKFRLSHCRAPAETQGNPNVTAPQGRHPLHLCFRSAGETTNLCLVYDAIQPESAHVEFRSDLRAWHHTEYRNVSAPDFSGQGQGTPLDVCSFRPATGASDIRINGKSHDSLFCRPSPEEEGLGPRCLLSMHSGSSSPCQDVVGDPVFTFWLYLGLRTLADALLIAALCLLEGVTLRCIQAGTSHRGAYGRSRWWAAGALALGPTPIGSLVDYYSDLAGAPDYSPAFFVFAGFELVACALLFALPLPVGGNTVRYTISGGLPSDQGAEDEKAARGGSTLELSMAGVVAIALGAAWSISQLFDPWLYTGELGFNHTVLGIITLTLPMLCALPFLWISKPLLQSLGPSSLLAAAFAFHALHHAGLSFAEEWPGWGWAVPFEAMRALALPVPWVALVAFVEPRSSKGRRIALHYAMVMGHFGLGRVVGCSVGGLLSEQYSVRTAYRATATFCLVMAFVTLSLHHLVLKPRQRKRMDARRSTQRLSVNGSCLQLMEHRPINGGRSIPHQ